jgi:amino acid transporter
VLVFILLVPAYIVLRNRMKDSDHPIRLPAFFVPLGVVITIFNIVLLLVGGPEWDATPVTTITMFGHGVDLTVMGLGWGIMAVVVPFYLYRTLVQDKRPQLVFAGGGGGAIDVLPELKEGDDDLGGRREVIHRETVTREE